MRRTLLLALAVSIVVGSAVGQERQTKGKNPCGGHRANGETSSWPTYIDRKHRFCFRYPPAYRAVKGPVRECRAPKLKRNDADAFIAICVPNRAFNDTNLVRWAPTGLEVPPEPMTAGRNTFYYYGAGGGGVSYPDSYYFDLRGKILLVEFYGPYDGRSKTPTEETKKMEQKLLATFRVF